MDVVYVENEREAKLLARIDVLSGRLAQALEHIEKLCGADWTAGDCAESDMAKTFVRDTRGRRLVK